MHQGDYKVWIYVGGNFDKVPECRVKPYDLVQRQAKDVASYKKCVAIINV